MTKRPTTTALAVLRALLAASISSASASKMKSMLESAKAMVTAKWMVIATVWREKRMAKESATLEFLMKWRKENDKDKDKVEGDRHLGILQEGSNKAHNA